VEQVVKDMKRISILNTWIDVCTKELVLETIIDVLENSRSAISVFATNPEKNYHVLHNKKLYNVIKNSKVLIPDGIGMVFAARLLYGIKIKRVPGIDIMDEICNLVSNTNYKIYIYGAKEKINKKAVCKLKEKYPKLKIAGRHNGYVDEMDMQRLIKRINESGSDILFLALGSPRQELWYEKYKNQLKNVKIVQGVGGSLDVIAGNLKRAPEFFQKFGIEWLYRLITEPKRIKRQRILPLFLYHIIITKIKCIGLKK
jgi:N-acetylglucosaminyldiphosphoundecaprenol N-acetyl-beta-D-mannosaminyltransferase